MFERAPRLNLTPPPELLHHLASVAHVAAPSSASTGAPAPSPASGNRNVVLAPSDKTDAFRKDVPRIGGSVSSDSPAYPQLAKRTLEDYKGPTQGHASEGIVRPRETSPVIISDRPFAVMASTSRTTSPIGRRLGGSVAVPIPHGSSAPLKSPMMTPNLVHRSMSPEVGALLAVKQEQPPLAQVSPRVPVVNHPQHGAGISATAAAIGSTAVIGLMPSGGSMPPHPSACMSPAPGGHRLTATVARNAPPTKAEPQRLVTSQHPPVPVATHTLSSAVHARQSSPEVPRPPRAMRHMVSRLQSAPGEPLDSARGKDILSLIHI